MNRLASRRVCGPLALALLICSVPAAAQGPSTPDRAFRVGLDELVAVEPLDFGAEPVPVFALATLPIRDARRLEQATYAQSTTASKDGKMKRGFRYMKKHWWIPSLIGLAVAVVILEPFDSTDAPREGQTNP